MASKCRVKSMHPCHNLSEPQKNMYWCRHCMKIFGDPMDRWRHSKTCREGEDTDDQLSAKEQTMKEGTLVRFAVWDADNVTSPPNNNSPKRSTQYYECGGHMHRSGPVVQNNRGQVNPKKFDLKCVICKKPFTSLDEMRYHVKNPCSKSDARTKNLFPAEIKNVFPNTPPSTPPKLDSSAKMDEVKGRTLQLNPSKISLGLSSVLSPPDLLQLTPPDHLQLFYQHDHTGDSLSQTGATVKIHNTYAAFDETDGVDTSLGAIVPEEIVLPDDHLLKFEEVTISDLAEIGILDYPEGIDIVELDGKIPTVQLVPLVVDGTHKGLSSSTVKDVIQTPKRGIQSSKFVREHGSVGAAATIAICKAKDPNHAIIPTSSSKKQRRLSVCKVNTCCLSKIPKPSEMITSEARGRPRKDAEQSKQEADKIMKDEHLPTYNKPVCNNRKKKKRNPYVKKRRAVNKKVKPTKSIGPLGENESSKNGLAVDKHTEEAKQKMDKTCDKKVCKPERPRKCRICGRVYKSLQLLQKHNRIPCRVKLTRNICAKVLRSKSFDKENYKNRLQRQTSTGEKQGMKPTGKRVKYRKKRKTKSPPPFRGNPNLPQYKLVFSELPEKEQFFFKLGMVALEHVPLKVETPLNCLISEASEDKELSRCGRDNTTICRFDLMTSKSAEEEIPALISFDMENSSNGEQHLNPPVLEMMFDQPIHADTLDDDGVESLAPPELDLIMPEANKHFLRFISPRETATTSVLFPNRLTAPKSGNKGDDLLEDNAVKEMHQGLVSTYKENVTKKACKDPYSILHPIAKSENRQGEKHHPEGVGGESVRHVRHRSSKRLEQRKLAKAAEQKHIKEKYAKETSPSGDGGDISNVNPPIETLSTGNKNLHDGSSSINLRELPLEKTDTITNITDKSDQLPTRQLRRRSSSTSLIETSPATAPEEISSAIPLQDASIRDREKLSLAKAKRCPPTISTENAVQKTRMRKSSGNIFVASSQRMALSPSKAKIAVLSPRKSLFESLQEISSESLDLKADSTTSVVFNNKCLSPIKDKKGDFIKNFSLAKSKLEKVLSPSKISPRKRLLDGSKSSLDMTEPNVNKTVNSLKMLSSAKIVTRRRLFDGLQISTDANMKKANMNSMKIPSSSKIGRVSPRKRFDESQTQPDLNKTVNSLKVLSAAKISPRKRLCVESQSSMDSNVKKTAGNPLRMIPSAKISPRKRLFDGSTETNVPKFVVNPLTVLSSAKIDHVSTRKRWVDGSHGSTDSINTRNITLMNKDHSPVKKVSEQHSSSPSCSSTHSSVRKPMKTVRVNDIITSADTGWTKISSKTNVPTKTFISVMSDGKFGAIGKRTSRSGSAVTPGKSHHCGDKVQSNLFDLSEAEAVSIASLSKIHKFPLIASRGCPPPVDYRAPRSNHETFKQDSPMRCSVRPTTRKDNLVEARLDEKRAQLNKMQEVPGAVSGAVNCHKRWGRRKALPSSMSTAEPVGSVSPGKTTIVLNLPSNVMLTSDGNTCNMQLKNESSSTNPTYVATRKSKTDNLTSNTTHSPTSPRSNFSRRCNLLRKKNGLSELRKKNSTVKAKTDPPPDLDPLTQTMPRVGGGLTPFTEDFPSIPLSLRENAESSGPKVTVQYIDEAVENTSGPSLMYSSYIGENMFNGSDRGAEVDFTDVYVFDDAAGLVVETEEIIEPGFSFDFTDPQFQSIQF